MSSNVESPGAVFGCPDWERTSVVQHESGIEVELKIGTLFGASIADLTGQSGRFKASVTMSGGQLRWDVQDLEDPESEYGEALETYDYVAREAAEVLLAVLDVALNGVYEVPSPR